MTYVFVVMLNGKLIEIFNTREGAEDFVKRNVMQGGVYKVHKWQVRYD